MANVSPKFMMHAERMWAARVLLAVCAVIVRPGAASTEQLLTVLTYDRHTDSQTAATPERPAEAHASQDTLIVQLGDSRLAIQEGQSRTMYDFDSRRMLMADDSKGTVDRAPLECVVSYRESEFHNRLGLGAALHGASVGDAAAFFQRPDLEELFGLEAPQEAPLTIEEQQEGDWLVYRVAGRESARAQLGEPLPDQLHGGHGKFLLYALQLHPGIRRRLEHSGRVLKTLDYTTRNHPSTVRVRLDLQQMVAAPGPLVLPKVSGHAAHMDERLSAALSDASASQLDVPAARAAAVAASTASSSQGRYLDAMLALLEHSLTTGESLTGPMQTVSSQAGNDQPLQLLMRGISYSNEAEARAALASLEQIDRANLSRAYVLDIFIANLKLALGDAAEAERLFLTVLSAHPRIAGVYHDLGGLYMQRYEVIKAWQCWDAARHLAPTHPMLEKVIQYGEHLRKDHPEYF